MHLTGSNLGLLGGFSSFSVYEFRSDSISESRRIRCIDLHVDIFRPESTVGITASQMILQWFGILLTQVYTDTRYCSKTSTSTMLSLMRLNNL